MVAAIRALRPAAAALGAALLAGCVSILPPVRGEPPDPSAIDRLDLRGPDGPFAGRERAAALALLRRQAPAPVVDDLFARTVSVDEPVLLGNSVQLLIDGPETHSAMYRAIHAARSHVNLVTYAFEDGGIGDELLDLLARKLEAGVRVHVAYDSAGSFGQSRDRFDRLLALGARVCEANPLSPLRARGAWRPNERDHRKLMVVDGAIGFVGGINISGVYDGASSAAFRVWRRDRSHPVWRDTHAELRGPAVAQLQRAFVDGWARQGCGRPDDTDFWPSPRAEGPHAVRVLAGRADDARRPIHRTLLAAISHARERVFLTAAYFVPEPGFIDALEAAARRGVDVRLLVPGFSDVPLALHAGRTHYARLLAAGVRIHERRDALLHAKTAVIDGNVSLVGSANYDWRSVIHNEELALCVIDASFGLTMETLFARDLSASEELDARRWAARGWKARVKERAARLFAWWL